MVTSHQVVNFRRRAQTGLAPDGKILSKEFPDFRVGILQVAEDDGLFLARLDARGKLPLGQPLVTEGALLDDTT